jgi:hypothetical protein
MGNISALSQITTSATALSNLILVSPQRTVGYQPQNPPTQNGSSTQPPPALLFHYEGENTAHLQSDITDHYIEDNTALQDQIALKPEEISTHGFIGELNDVAPPILAAVQAVADKLTTIGAYVPALSATALLAYAEAFQLYQVAQNAINSGVAAWSTITGQGGESVIGSQGLISQPNQTKQQVMFQQFYGYWRNRTLFTVQTPWAIFQNMAIKDLVALQDEKTNVITDFNVTFKMIRIATTQTSVFAPSVLQGRASAQGSSLTDLGTSTPPVSTTLNNALSSTYPGLGVVA